MNTYLLIYVCIHSLIVLVSAWDVIMKILRLQKFLSLRAGDNWFADVARARIHLKRSVFNFSFAMAGELLSLWLIFMAGAFDK
jgi:hypothetical protein